MPEIFRYFGMRFYFYSREHEPIHVHVKNQDGKAKFNLLPNSVILVENNGIKAKDIKMAQAILEENLDIAINKWISFFGINNENNGTEY